METKFTQDEWEIRPACVLNENGKPLFYDIAVDERCFLSTYKNVYIEGMDDEMQLANAKIARAAPEMFEMLYKLSLIFDNFAMPTEQNLSDYSNEIKQLLTKITK